jgi:hypothetical protein
VGNEFGGLAKLGNELHFFDSVVYL